MNMQIRDIMHFFSSELLKYKKIPLQEKKRRDLTRSNDKNPNILRRKLQKSKVTTPKRHKNFDYTTIVDLLRTVYWSNDSYSTGVVKPIYKIQTLPLTAKDL